MDMIGGYDRGHDEGYSEGYKKGLEDGYAGDQDAKWYAGFERGYQSAIDECAAGIPYAQGYEDAREDFLKQNRAAEIQFARVFSQDLSDSGWYYSDNDDYFPDSISPNLFSRPTEDSAL